MYSFSIYILLNNMTKNV